jgi:3,4-dihydroxy 2-butanone 4-phosphate synthase/GTP cyclohydrolase II
VREIATKFNLKLISIKDLIAYRLAKETLIKEEEKVNMPTKYGMFELVGFSADHTGEIHLAIKKAIGEKNEPVLVRVHSSLYDWGHTRFTSL